MSFETSIEFCLKVEGGYCDVPGDTGGETYKGIARNKFPNWAGWTVIDEAKTQMNPGKTHRTWAAFTKFVEENYPALQDDVVEFYHHNFWVTQDCDSFAEPVAHLLLDFGINSGLKRAAKHLQQGLNAVGVAVVVDGSIGQHTVDAANSTDPQELAYKMLEDRQAFYNALVAHDPGANTQFIDGWTNRVQANLNFINSTYFA